ncbi:hypothetical protein EYC84_005306 [Monilinia fructicola]|uniref:Uncharacterized protein n=1 Tax=Monilinia fructicola TaxID=38448 RepID=A0A5M9JX04_MONFR|nr:hypothetical protein EYC84_005306 [Monilinia fructicola]
MDCIQQQPLFLQLPPLSSLPQGLVTRCVNLSPRLQPLSRNSSSNRTEPNPISFLFAAQSFKQPTVSHSLGMHLIITPQSHRLSMPTRYYTFVHGVFVQSPFVSLRFTSRSTDYDMCRVIELREPKELPYMQSGTFSQCKSRSAPARLAALGQENRVPRNSAYQPAGNLNRFVHRFKEIRLARQWYQRSDGGGFVLGLGKGYLNWLVFRR